MTFLQYQIVNWPANFKIGSVYSASTEEAASPTPMITESEDENGVLRHSVFETNGWAEAQLAAADGCIDFQMPKDYVVRTKDGMETRKKKEDRFREQWDDAVNNMAAWNWVCPTCLSKLKDKMVGLEVKVWWHDDAQSYRGVINAFDPVSGNHRVLYEDDEWEFVNLAIEPFLVYPKVELSMLEDEPVTPSAKSSKKKQKTSRKVVSGQLKQQQKKLIVIVLINN